MPAELTGGLRQTVLYVHPSGHLNDLVVPSGVLSCMNAIGGPKRGRYAFEVSDEEIREAGIVAIDFHWGLALPGLERLVAHVRRVRVDVPIVVGGISAGFFARELLDRLSVDFVVQGDAERPFAELVRRLRAGESATQLANVHARDRRSPRIRRMTSAEIDESDCVTADWFPSFELAAGWDARAFPVGRTIPVSRGCALRCPDCYGSYADSFGGGCRLMSPSRVANLVALSARLGFRNLRLFLGKPSHRVLTAIFRAVAGAGPFRFPSTVGFYLCTPPSSDELSLLEAAFETPVALSMIPPDQHVPVVPCARLAMERDGWRRAAEHIGRSHVLSLDLWTSRSGDVPAIRDWLGAPRGDRVRISYAAVWSMTRPVEGCEVEYDTLREAMAPVWTFFAAKCLSPSIAELLAPYGLLDELDVDVEAERSPRPALLPFLELLREGWKRDHLPTLPGLSFAVVPCRFRLRSVERGQAVYRGEAARGDITGLLGPAVVLGEIADHRGVTLTAEVHIEAGAEALAIVPCPLTGDAPDARWIGALGSEGVVVLKLPPAVHGVFRAELTVRVQGVRIVLRGLRRESIAEGSADLGYFWMPRRAPCRRKGPDA